ncbi:MAG: transporter, periplasmic substrate-binding protein [Rhodospirillales bacterium]|nr:transporter, periplasmic substrate-binding protein [Rhodospirillales bacterium]
MTGFASRYLAAALLLSLAALSTPFARAEPFRIIITEPETPLVPNAVIELADRLGYYKKAGVEVELIRVKATPSAVAALRSGQGDMANIGFDIALQLNARAQMQLRGVIVPDKALPFVIVAKKDIATPKQLEGRVFGVSQVGSVDYVQSRMVLSKLGVGIDSLRFLAVGQPMIRAQALAAGQIDATAVTLGTWLTFPNKDGLGLLVDQAAYYQAAPLITKLNVVTADTAKNRHKEVEAVVHAILAASRDFAKAPESWVDAMAQARPDVQREQLEVLARAYAKSWVVDGGLDERELEFTTDAFYKSDDFKDIPRRVLPAEWIDRSFVETALHALGGK